MTPRVLLALVKCWNAELSKDFESFLVDPDKGEMALTDLVPEGGATAPGRHEC